MSEVIITPLGTVSPYCKDNMNCPGFLIEYDNERILLDCGNGITKLLKFPDDLNNLNVFISHYHRDHYGDIGALQYSSYVYHILGLLDNKIRICLPDNDIGFSKEWIMNNMEDYSEYKFINNWVKYNIGDMEVSFYDNKSHSIESYMIKLENDNFKVIYTSDIGINNFDGLVNFCKNADLIICESSLLRKYNSESKIHFRACDAGRLAKDANAKRLLLTHFWPEEDKKLYLEEAKEVFENTDIAIEGKKLILRR